MTKDSRELFKFYSEKLKEIYSEQEAKSITFWLMEFYLGATRKDILANKQWETISNSGIEEAYQKVLAGIPIQQVTGLGPFYGREFIVNSNVLIPRNETEELVHLIITENKLPYPKILDIGTGSGCIAITLALEIPGAQVSSIDISAKALDTAKKNAALHKTTVGLQQLDILSEELPFIDLDIIVSNPPYVRESEKSAMHLNVLHHEPHLALFVRDEDPLIFYREIALKAGQALKDRGRLYFEINEALAEDTKLLMEAFGFCEVKIIQDLNGKMRMASGILKEKQVEIHLK